MSSWLSPTVLDIVDWPEVRSRGRMGSCLIGGCREDKGIDNYWDARSTVIIFLFKPSNEGQIQEYLH